MTEETPAEDKPMAPVDRAPEITPNPSNSLTIPESRLSGSPACLNCGTDLKGPFCYYCGQPDKNLMRFFPVLIRDMLEDVLDFDSRFTRTLKPLLAHPGRLTSDYLNGRRFRYLPPMRLYIISSMVFFILAAMLTGDAIEINRTVTDDGLNISIGSDEEQLSETLDELVDAGTLTREKADMINAAGIVTGDAEADSEEEEQENVISFGDEPWDRESNPLIIPGMPGFINNWVNNEIAESPQKGREIEENPKLMFEKVLDVLPVTVFFMLPLVALLFKFWYLFARKFYVEHLIHALHNHAFLFVIFTLALLLDSISTWLNADETGLAYTVSTGLGIVLLCWIPVYLLISLKTVYQQGWTLTLLKFSVIGLSYMSLLLAVTSFVALLSFVLL
jgi:hypothetical protein